jgi:hypothetical protein
MNPGKGSFLVLTVNHQNCIKTVEEGKDIVYVSDESIGNNIMKFLKLEDGAQTVK